MTYVNPVFLVSWQDLLNTMLTEGAMPEILSKLPNIIHSILLHNEAIQPIYMTLLYWTSYVPTDMWSNQTVLDRLKLDLENITHPQKISRRRLLADTNRPAKVHPLPSHREWSDGPYNWMPHQIYWNLPGNNQRKLLLQEPTLQSSESTVNTVPSAETVFEWSQGPYTWPPNFNCCGIHGCKSVEEWAGCYDEILPNHTSRTKAV